MHVPDGFLDTKTVLATAVLATSGLGVAMSGVRRDLPEWRVPLVGLAAAFVFAAQMLNFPVAGGTSGHLIGATLVAVLLGPNAAVVVMSAVVILQSLMFADGGLTALGANVFNLALVAPATGYAVYAALRRITGDGLRARLFATAFAAWCSTVAASLACAGELALSGTVPWRLVLPAMAGVHMVIGLGEAVLTTLVVAAVARVRPELLPGPARPGLERRHGDLALQGILVVLGLVLFVAPFACGWPDGLEMVAESLGFGHLARGAALSAPLPDYTVPGVGPGAVSTLLAGGAGALVAFGLAWLLSATLAARRGSGAATAGKGDATDAPRAG